MASQLCDRSISADVLSSFSDKYAEDSVFDTINEIQNSIEDTVVHCRLLEEMVNCSQILSPITSEDGFCLSFNTMHMYDFGTNE